MAGKTKPAANQDLSNDLINEAAGLDSKTGNPGSDNQTEATVNDGDPAPGNLEPLNQPNAGADLPKPNTIPLPGPEAEADSQAPTRDLPVRNAGKEPNEETLAPLYAGDAKDADAATLHQDRESKYGPDYVVATRAGNQQTVFTALAWNKMRGDKGGWKEQVQVPSEVRELRNSKK